MSGGRIFLLVEDDLNQVSLMEIAFHKIHSQVQLHAVRDGVEAQQYMTGEGDYWDRRKHPLPNVIVLDLRMPRLDGFDFLEWLRSRPNEWERNTPVVVMSCWALPAQIARAYELGANGYLIKAFGWNELCEQVKGLGAFWETVETARICSTP